ncbi:hypothetical protein [Longispora fulva]|uniref:FtsH-binding integral membrane protein n=1 Tax=Longispora fulva TaxID=619741 RepID=A0A8J7GFD8_9ACTN|nr:hypothetical protein [Longispora fulva]MBG6139668.1 FtsH-binding integral membrane protein [Longispora fulva]
MDKGIGTWDGPRHRDPASAERRVLPAMMATAGWYLVPAFLFVLWFLFFSRTSTGAGIHLKPAVVLTAVGLGLVLAVPLRMMTRGWQAMTVGFAASVISAGLTTILFTGVGTT